MSQPTSPSLVQDLDLSTEAVLSGAWQLFKKHWKQFYLVGGVWFVLVLVAQMAVEFVDEKSVAYLPLLFGSIVLSIILNLSWIWITIKLSRDEDIAVADLFEKIDRIGVYFLATLLYQLVVMVGFILFVIPGIYFSVKYAYVPFLVVDRGAKVKDAFKMSGQMTQGLKLRVIWLGIAAGFIGMLGFFLFFVGGLITIPIWAIAPALIYTRLCKRIEGNTMTTGPANVMPAPAAGVTITETTKSAGPPPGLPTV